jgi:hypothetical protein
VQKRDSFYHALDLSLRETENLRPNRYCPRRKRSKKVVDDQKQRDQKKSLSHDLKANQVYKI